MLKFLPLSFSHKIHKVHSHFDLILHELQIRLRLEIVSPLNLHFWPTGTSSGNFQLRKLARFGHCHTPRQSLQTFLQGTLESGRRCGGQTKCWMDNIKEWTSLLPFARTADNVDPPAEKTDWGSLLNHGIPPDDPVGQRTELNWVPLTSETPLTFDVTGGAIGLLMSLHKDKPSQSTKYPRGTVTGHRGQCASVRCGVCINCHKADRQARDKTRSSNCRQIVNAGRTVTDCFL